ncbi:hypothetical protein BJ912DRAFT_1146195 [Pholiota molesta]|nr:hypothetical protein BJ912DRAFT_1146195 [Pholiota molesta]
MNPDKGKRKRSQSPEDEFRRPQRRHAASHSSAQMDLRYLYRQQQASGSTTTAPPMVEWRAHPTWGPSTSCHHPPETERKNMTGLRRKYVRVRDQEGALATDTEAGRIERPRWNFSYTVRGVETPQTSNEGSTQGWNRNTTLGSGSAVGADQITNNPDDSVRPSQAPTPSLMGSHLGLQTRPDDGRREQEMASGAVYAPGFPHPYGGMTYHDPPSQSPRDERDIEQGL